MFESKPAKEIAARLGVPWPPANGFFTFRLPTTKKGHWNVLLLTDTEIVWGQLRLPLWSSRASLNGSTVVIEGIDQDIVLPMRPQDKPAAIVKTLKALERAMPDDPEIEAKRAARRQKRAAATQVATAKAAERALVAKFAPGLVHSIKLYANGDVEYSWGNKSGNVIGAVARVDQSGSQRVFRDTRQAYITIEGPRVSISQALASDNKSTVQFARQFAAKVNQVSQQLTAKAASQNQPVHAPAPAPTIAPTPAPGIPEQIRKLGELKQQGLLTEEEFAAKKTELLGRL